jgi:hypothetical protein
MAGGVAQVVLENLPSKCEALSSNPNTAQKKKKVARVCQSSYHTTSHLPPYPCVALALSCIPSPVSHT